MRSANITLYKVECYRVVFLRGHRPGSPRCGFCLGIVKLYINVEKMPKCGILLLCYWSFA